MSAVYKFDPRIVSEEAERSRAALLRALLEGAGGGTEAPEGTIGTLRDALVLHLEDLLPDEAGEIVLRHGTDASRLLLVTGRDVVETGRAVPHVTATGENVSGMRYAVFRGGPVLYYGAELELEVVRLRG